MDLNYLTRNGQAWVGQHSYLENFTLQVSINFNIDWFVKFCCHRKIQRVMQVNGLLLSNMNVILPDAVLLEIYVISLNQKKQKGSWSDSSSVQLAVGIHPINRLLRGYNTLLNLLIKKKTSSDYMVSSSFVEYKFSWIWCGSYSRKWVFIEVQHMLAYWINW